ncbi:hypothetical protein PoB_001531600 [Plakobranchus ocellatus]|uniref:Uncharacterized protein n=1 Tax=Plakobranchus ocellatus TaxID=259542 RepID=A0AAV3Z2K0_9GAST|nr:hypothetical protein PoB_001531600 [Plakobranchus ocellatus]
MIVSPDRPRGFLLRKQCRCGTVDSKSALRSVGTILSRVRALPPAPWPGGGPESLKSPCCGLAIHKDQTNLKPPSFFPLTCTWREAVKEGQEVKRLSTFIFRTLCAVVLV